MITQNLSSTAAIPSHHWLTTPALGFIIDPKGNWSLHIQQTAADARKRLGAIRRVAHLLDNQGIMMAYKAFVRSKIEYGNLVYWGAANTNLGMLDKVQQSAISLLDDPEPSLLPGQST